jgi:hypothetical protein
MIKGIKRIESKELRDNITDLYYKVLDLISYRNTKHFEIATLLLIDRLLYNHILGVNAPICICNNECDLRDGEFVIYIQVDYKVTSGYEPYQDLDEPLIFSFTIDENLIRDYKISKVLC